jgi:Flp pilus assembly protein TadB
MSKNSQPRTAYLFRAAGALILATLACRPVVTIGWGELLLVGLLAVLVLGPLLIRFFRQARRQDNEIKEKEE